MGAYQTTVHGSSNLQGGQILASNPRISANPRKNHIPEHATLKNPLTAIGEHCTKYNHKISMDNVEVVAREEHFWKRKIKEAMEIRTQQPTLNRDTGYDLPAIYDNLLSHDRPHGWSCD